MLRKYIRWTCRGQGCTEALQTAVAAVKSGMNLRQATKKFGIPAITLHPHDKGKTTWRYIHTQGFGAPSCPDLWRGAEQLLQLAWQCMS